MLQPRSICPPDRAGRCHRLRSALRYGFRQRDGAGAAELAPGELAAPILLPSASSPTGELWVVLHLDELQSELTDLSAIGPFAAAC